MHPRTTQNLGDDQHCLIKTVSRRGYLLDVSISAGEVTSVPAPRLTRTATVPWTDYIPKHEAEETEHEVLAGERKHVTVLCADLKGSLERVAASDAELALKVFDTVLELMTQAVHRYEGTVNLVTGDGIMALFGAPLAQEAHAIRACYAALQMQEAVKRYAQGSRDSPGVPIVVRAGLSSGEVVIRSMARGPHMEYRVMGQTTHLATRLGHIAAPGTLLQPVGGKKKASKVLRFVGQVEARLANLPPCLIGMEACTTGAGWMSASRISPARSWRWPVKTSQFVAA
jgi:class 3 adenylate cyclase